jgi:hypothetical protein
MGRPARADSVAKLAARAHERRTRLNVSDDHPPPAAIPDAGSTPGEIAAALALFHAFHYTPIADDNGNSWARHWLEKRLSEDDTYVPSTPSRRPAPKAAWVTGVTHAAPSHQAAQPSLGPGNDGVDQYLGACTTVVGVADPQRVRAPGK